MKYTKSQTVMGLEIALLTLKELRKNKELTKVNKLNVMILS